MAEINIHFAFRHVWRWYGTATWTRIQRMLLNLNFFLQQYCLCSIHSGITIILQLRNAIGDTRYLWPHGVVHWTIDSHHSGRYWSYLKGQMRPIVHYFSILFSLQYEDFHTAISKLYFYAIWYFFSIWKHSFDWNIWLYW